MTEVVCVKVDNLRLNGYKDLEQWMSNPNNIYVGRRGRIFIHTDNGKRIFHYPGNKWQNPYNLKNYSVRESLILYVNHLFESKLIYDIDELRGKNLGCFCKNHKENGIPICHAQVLSDLLNNCYHILEKNIRQ